MVRVIEVVDSEANIDRIMPQVDRMVRDGLVTMERVRVIRYAPVSHGSSN